MAPTAHAFDSWGDDYDTVTVIIDCLLPTGVIVPFEVYKESTLADIKAKLWVEARKYPLYSQLKDQNSYMFMCINEMAERIELYDEARRLSEVRPFHPMLKVIEKKGKQEDKLIKAEIGSLIGKGLHEFDALKSPEVSDFRVSKKVMCESIAKQRDNQSWLERLKSFFLPDVAPEATLPRHIESRLKNGRFQVQVRIENTALSTFRMECYAKPDELIQKALTKRTNTSGIPLGRAEDYILKVCGREEYLPGEYPLSQFVYVRRMIIKDVTPKLVLVPRATVAFECEPPPPPPPRGTTPLKEQVKQHKEPPPHAATPRVMERCLWDCDDQDKYILELHSVNNVSVSPNSKVQLRACLYHGGDAMCGAVISGEASVTEEYCKWSDKMTFDMPLKHLPRMARLCFMVYALGDRQRKEKKEKGADRVVRDGKQEMIPLAWVNLPVFDFKGHLRTGVEKLYMWAVTRDDVLTEELLNPIGTVECNPDVGEAVCLHFTIHNGNSSWPIYYPPHDQVVEAAAKSICFTNVKSDIAQVEVTGPEGIRKTITSALLDGVEENHLEQLKLMIERDPLHVLHDNEKEAIWLLRYECQFYFPRSLPKLLTCVQWNNSHSVMEMQALLQGWKPLPPTLALELLDFRYADKTVRKRAVEWLKQLSDAELCQYLLQLVQVLKYESYLDCDLVDFLLRRALMNQKIGNYFFWLLRSEMHVLSVAVRFGLILEAYCHGNLKYMKSLSKQVDALSKLKTLNESVKKCQMPREKCREEMRSRLKQSPFTESLSNIQSPLDPGERVRGVNVEKCKVMDSKMKPLWMVWNNNDEDGEDVFMLYKKGDDLKQDMLTLQILKIMDNMWQAEGLDLRLNAYSCLATGHMEGLLGIVTNATTVANIQKESTNLKLSSAFNKHCLYNWLKYNNKDKDSLNKALEEFMMSCAGYSVATYVLGIGDRHSDNIMLKTNGQLFHIDFGHILGHFKTKLGVKREQGPFILTNNFVYTIKRGPEDSNPAYDRFKTLCEQAFLVLHRQSHFLIKLFMMMMNTGLPELNSTKDIEYLRNALVPHLNEDEAVAHFRQKLIGALKNGKWYTLNDTAHNVAKDNK